MENFNRNPPPIGKPPEWLLKKREAEDARIKESFASVEHLDIKLFPEIVALLPGIETFFNQRREAAGLDSITIGEDSIRLIDSAIYQSSDIIHSEVQTGAPAFYERLNRFTLISIERERYKQERWYQVYIIYSLLHELAHLSMEGNGIAEYDYDDFPFIMNEAVADLLAKELYTTIRSSVLSEEENEELNNPQSVENFNSALPEEFTRFLQFDASEILFLTPTSPEEGITFSRVPEMKILEILENVSPGYRDEVINYALNGDSAGLIAASKARFAGEPCEFIIKAYGDITDKLQRMRQLYPL